MRPCVPAILAALFLASCRDHAPAPPLMQRAYVWQRDWNLPVAAAMAQSASALDGYIVLAAEIDWHDGAPRTVKPRIDWPALRATGKPAGLALRLAPRATMASEDGATVEFLCATARDLIAASKAGGVFPAELQLDYDCAQKKLPGYAPWVRAVREAIKPVPLVITALPAWLEEPEFRNVAREAARYVLQVHSVRLPKGEIAPQICDPVLARKWVAQAEAIGLPFEIALPTYRYQAGYDEAGKFVGIDSDSVRPDWPPGTRVKEFATNPAAMAELVRYWNLLRMPHCAGLVWYRLPVESDRNNWPMATLRAVMAGREPRSSFVVRVDGVPPKNDPVQLADLSVLNDGETDDAPRGEIMVTWDPGSHAVAEALPGWALRLEAACVHFAARKDAGARLPPGAVRAIGWLRLEPAAPIHVEVIR